MDTMHYDADCGIEDAENHVNVSLGLREDPHTGLLRFDSEAVEPIEFDEETEYGYITYVS